MMKTTNANKKWWERRKIDWRKSYLSTWTHPHRALIVGVLSTFNWLSLWEVGCGPGANLVRILKDIPGKRLGGSDVNKEAIEVAKKEFKNALFHVESGDDMLLSDKSVDVVLSDMTLIYVGPFLIRRYIREFKRVARNVVVLCEFHSNSLFDRILCRLGGYNAYNYRSLLEGEGFYNVSVYQIPPEAWPGTDRNTGRRSIIVARVPEI